MAMSVGWSVGQSVPRPLQTVMFTIHFFTMAFGTDIQGLLGMNLNVLGDPLTLPLVSAAALHFWF